MRGAAVLAVLLAAAPAAAQQNDTFTLTPDLNLDGAGEDGSYQLIEEVEQARAVTATGGVLRALDRVSGALQDLDLTSGQSVRYSSLVITLSECRYPEGNPNGDAYGHVVVQPASVGAPVFAGWMIASSPALNAMDHPRYDVWLLRCRTS